MQYSVKPKIYEPEVEEWTSVFGQSLTRRQERSGDALILAMQASPYRDMRPVNAPRY